MSRVIKAKINRALWASLKKVGEIHSKGYIGVYDMMQNYMEFFNPKATEFGPREYGIFEVIYRNASRAPGSQEKTKAKVREYLASLHAQARPEAPKLVAAPKRVTRNTENERVGELLGLNKNSVRRMLEKFAEYFDADKVEISARDLELLRVIQQYSSNAPASRETVRAKLAEFSVTNAPATNVTPMGQIVEASPVAPKGRSGQRAPKPITRDIPEPTSRQDARPECKALGKIFALLREAFEVKASRFALMLGMSDQGYLNIEAGKNVPSLATIEACSERFKLKISTLFALAEAWTESNGRLMVNLSALKGKITLLEGDAGWMRFVRAVQTKDLASLIRNEGKPGSNGGTNYTTSHRFGA